MTQDIFQALGLASNPFSMAADTEGYFHTETTKQILDELAFGILSRKGFLLLTGEVGVGKTSLLYQLLRRLEGEQLVTSWIFNTMLNKEELLHAIARDFGLDAPKTANVAQLVDLLQVFLVEQNTEDKNCAIIVDEAHNLSLPAMEALRMLSNLETSGRKLVQILLVGQPELKARLDETKLRQLRSRITIFRELQAFSREEIGHFVNFKLSSAQSQFRISKAPLKTLYEATLGNTRMVNLVMERTLYAAVAFGDADITVRAVKAAVAEIATCQVEVAERLASKKRGVRNMAAVAVLLLLFAASVVSWVPTSQGAKSPVGLLVTAYLSVTKDDSPPPMEAAAAPAPAPEQKKAEPAKVAEQEVKVPEQISKPVTASDSMEKKASATEVAAVSTDAVSGNNSLTGFSKTAKQFSNEEPSKEPVSYPQSYLDFLKPVGLENKASELARAVGGRELAVFEEVLPRGVQLLKLDRLPKKGVVRYTAFPWKKTVNDNPAWIVLWEPPFVVQDFYYGYRNENILTLQRMLKRLGYYWGPDDGMVGPVTWRAINSFQKDMKLKRTMWPDPETVFWLNVMSKQG